MVKRTTISSEPIDIDCYNETNAPTAFFMANLLSKFITDRFITLAVQAQLPTVQKDTTAFAVGVWPEQQTDLKHPLR
jgi:hypothetical protein